MTTFMDAAPRTDTKLRRTVHRLMLETIPHEAHQPRTGVLVRFISPKVSGIDEKEVRRIVNNIVEDPASGFVLSSYGVIQRRLTPAEIYAMHRDMKQHLAASTLRSPSGRPMVECRVFVESLQTLVVTTSGGTASEMLKQFYEGVSDLFGVQWCAEQVQVGGKTVCGRSLQDLPDKASIVARNRDLIAALEEGNTAVPFPPPGPRQCQPAHSMEARDVVHRLMLEAVPQVHALPTLAALIRCISPKIPGIDEKVLRSIITTIVEEAGSEFAFSNRGEVQRRLTPAEIYAMHRDMKQHLAASALRSPSGRPGVECRLFVESMKTLVLTTSNGTAWAMGRQFYKGVGELFGQHWVQELVRVGGKAICCRSLQDLRDKASIVARNRDLIAALEEGSTAVPFPRPAPLPAEAPAVAAPAVQRRGRGVAPKRQREAGPSDTEGRRAAHT